MKKIYRIEQEGTFDGEIEDFEIYEDALSLLTKILHDNANYNYSSNRKNVFCICEVNRTYLEDNDEDEYEDEYFDTLISLSVEEYYNMNNDERTALGLSY